MAISRTILLHWLLPAGAGVLMLATAGCTNSPRTGSVAIPPVPAGEARVWFYRDLNPYESMGTPYIRMNDAIAAISEPGGASYRDVAPGQYHITVDSYGKDFNQFKDVSLSPGQQLYFKIVSLRDWVVGSGGAGGNGGGGGGGSMQRDTFYVWIIPAEVAQADVARSPFFGGS